MRDEILLVHATGPRGNASRRQRTRQHPIAVALGLYQVKGYLHALPGADALASIGRRKPMVPLTDAWIEYATGAVRQRRWVGAVVVNREQIDAIIHALDEKIELPNMPVGAEQQSVARRGADHTERDNLLVDGPPRCVRRCRPPGGGRCRRVTARVRRGSRPYVRRGAAALSGSRLA